MRVSVSIEQNGTTVAISAERDILDEVTEFSATDNTIIRTTQTNHAVTFAHGVTDSALKVIAL